MSAFQWEQYAVTLPITPSDSAAVRRIMKKFKRAAKREAERWKLAIELDLFGGRNE